MKAWITAAILLGAVSQLAAADASLIDAARQKDHATALTLIKDGADVNAAAADGSTALHWAVIHNDVELVNRLLKARAKVDVTNDYGASPLSEAAVLGNTAVLASLIKAGADVNTPNAYGQTPLMVVARTSNVEAAQLLLRHHANVNAAESLRGQTALMLAAANGQPEMIRLLVKHGADVNARSTVHNWERQVSGEPRAQYRPLGGLTPLLFAARAGCLACVEALVEAGADIDMADPEGITPLLTAIDNIHFDVANFLIDRGASINKWDWFGRTPLYAAVDMNTLPRGRRADLPPLDKVTAVALIEKLLKAGADPNAPLKLRPQYRSLGDRGCDSMITVGFTPLLRAAKAFDADAIRLLLQYGADVNRPQVIGITPVMAAAGLGSWDCDTRGNFTSQDVQQRSIKALDLLLKAGADINARVREKRGEFCCPVPDSAEAFAVISGQSAVYGAAFWGWDDVVRYLVDHGARLDGTDAHGKTVLDAALGRAGGNGFQGRRIDVHEKTAALLRQLASTKRIAQQD